MSSSRGSSRSRRSGVGPSSTMDRNSNGRSIFELLTEAITELKISTLETSRCLTSFELKSDARMEELAKRVETLEEARWVPRYYADQPMGQPQVHNFFVRPTPRPPSVLSRASSIISGNEGHRLELEPRATTEDMQRNANTVSTRGFADRPREQPPVRHLFVRPISPSPNVPSVSRVAEGGARLTPKIRKANLEKQGLNRYVCPKCGAGYASSYVLTHVKRCQAGGRR